MKDLINNLTQKDSKSSNHRLNQGAGDGRAALLSAEHCCFDSSLGGGSKEDLRVEPLGAEQLLHLRRGVERRLQHRRRDRLPHQSPPCQVAKDQAAQDTI